MTKHLCVCVCTYRRPEMLERLLRHLADQETRGEFTFSVVVADNDRDGTGRAAAEAAAAQGTLEIRYGIQPEQNIALTRNAAVAWARGEYVAFIDDDEFPERDWLLRLHRTCEALEVAGVLGPVKPHFVEGTPDWLIRSGIYDRPAHPTGFMMGWEECRTGNVLLRRDAMGSVSGSSSREEGPAPEYPGPFRTEFGTGGEDQDFFRRMMEAGHRFAWCNEAVAWETVPESRCKLGVILSRAMLRGKNSLRHSQGRSRNLLKAMIAVPAYAISLPFLFIAGKHLAAKYLVKTTDHAGRLLASVGLNPVKDRLS